MSSKEGGGVLGAGCWVLGAGCWVLGAGCRVLWIWRGRVAVLLYREAGSRQ